MKYISRKKSPQKNTKNKISPQKYKKMTMKKKKKAVTIKAEKQHSGSCSSRSSQPESSLFKRTRQASHQTKQQRANILYIYTDKLILHPSAPSILLLFTPLCFFLFFVFAVVLFKATTTPNMMTTNKKDEQKDKKNKRKKKR